MKKRLYYLITSMVVLSLLASACAGGRGRKYSIRHRPWSISKAKVPQSEVKLVVNDRVRAWLDYFQGAGRERFTRYLQRSGRYIPLMKQILSGHGLPEDVVYIALIESGFTASARSYANAVGFWQFIRSTGRNYDLRIDPFVDERMDPVKSTHAAARYLTDLYNMFGDWHLAFAGYNSGEGKVGRAIEKYGTNDFWELTHPRNNHFRAETKDYVPKYIAATILAKNPKKYGFRVDYEKPAEYDEIKASTQTDYEVIAKCAGADYDEIAKLNPELIMGVTPPGEHNYPIKVPKGQGKRFLTVFAKLPKEERLVRVYEISPRYHVVKRGETAAKIASQYGISMSLLLETNNIRNIKRIKPGRKLIIPGSGGPVYYGKKRSSDRLVASSSKLRDLIKYKVKAGDTIGEIASRYGVNIEDVKKWNKLKGDNIAIDRKLKIYRHGVTPDVAGESALTASATETSEAKPVSNNYAVKRGDTLGAIAKKHGVTVANLKAWNNLKGNNNRIGEKLVVGKKSAPVMALRDGTTVVAAADAKESSGQPMEESSSQNVNNASKQKKTAVYEIKSGDSLYLIARKNNISVADLCRINNISRTSILKPGMKMKLGGSEAQKASAPAPKTSSDRLILTNNNTAQNPADVTTTVPAATPDAASTDAVVTVPADATTTPDTNNPVPVDETKATPAGIASAIPVDMPKAAPANIAKVVPADMSKMISYKVKKGDTAWNIAKKHNVNISQIKDWNNGADLSKLKAGDVIKLKLATKEKM